MMCSFFLYIFVVLFAFNGVQKLFFFCMYFAFKALDLFLSFFLFWFVCLFVFCLVFIFAVTVVE